MADIDELFGGFEEPLGFDEEVVMNPVVTQIDENDIQTG